MKRLSPLLLLLCLLLSGCGGNRAGAAYAGFSEALSARRDLRFTAAVCAEYADRSLHFTLRYAEDAEGCRIEVLEPRTLKGVTVHLGPDGSQLGYDSILLDTGDLDRYGLSPLSALPKLAAALRGGHLDSAWTEGGETVWQLQEEDALVVQVWLDESLTPQRAELFSDERLRVSLTLSDWQ